MSLKFEVQEELQTRFEDKPNIGQRGQQPQFQEGKQKQLFLDFQSKFVCICILSIVNFKGSQTGTSRPVNCNHKPSSVIHSYHCTTLVIKINSSLSFHEGFMFYIRRRQPSIFNQVLFSKKPSAIFTQNPDAIHWNE